MDNIAFVLWNVLWPLGCSLSEYLSAKKRAITGEKEPSNDSKFITAIVQIIIWVSVAKSL